MTSIPAPADLSSPRSARGLLLAVAVLAVVVAVLAELGWGATSADSLRWQALTLGVLALPLVFGGGAALGPLLIATPTVEPSPLKLGLFASVLSPVFVGALWYGLAMGLGWPPARAWSITFLAIGACALFGLQRKISTVSQGRAAGLAGLLALVAAVIACAVVWSPAGFAARIGSSETIAQATLAQTMQDGGAYQNPWVSGLPLALRPTFAAWLVAAAGPASLAPFFSLGFVIGWCGFVISIAGYLASAALFHGTAPERAGLRDLVSAAAVLLAAAALDGGRWSPVRWVSMAYTLAFVLAALHAIRRGARPWPGLACWLLGLVGLFHPWLAAALVVPFAASALVMRRWNLAPLAVLATLPGFFVARTHGGLSFEQAVPYLAPRSTPGDFGGLVGWALGDHFAPGGSVVGWGPLALGALALLVLVLRGGRAGQDGKDRVAARAGGALMLLFLAGLFATIALLPDDSRGEAPGLAGAACLLATLGVGRAVQWIPSRAIGALIGLAFLGWLAVPVWRDRATAPRAVFPFSEGPYGVTVEIDRPLEEGLGEALEFLRTSPLAADPSAILLREPGPLGPVPRDEPLSMTPLLAGISLWGTRAPSPGTDQARALMPPRAELRTELGDTPLDRRELLEALFEREGKWEQRFVRVLEAARKRGHTLVFLVTEADRRSTTDRGEGPRGVDGAILRMGAEEIFQRGEVSVYVLRPLAP